MRAEGHRGRTKRGERTVCQTSNEGAFEAGVCLDRICMVCMYGMVWYGVVWYGMVCMVRYVCRYGCMRMHVCVRYMQIKHKTK